MPDRTLSVLDGSTFVVGDRLGDIRADEGREHGFFADDTRVVSRWVLCLEDASLELLSLDQHAHFVAQFFLTPIVGPDDQAPCSIARRRLVDHVWREEVTVTNHLHQTNHLRLSLEVDADFADLFEIKDGVVREREVTRTHDHKALTLAYERAGFHRSVTIASSRRAAITRLGFEYTLELAPGEQWVTAFTFTPYSAQPGVKFGRRKPRGELEDVNRARSAELEAWLARAPALEAHDPALVRTYLASLSDLGALRMHPDITEGATLPAAGLPWFMALFGRDSLLTSFQALPYLPGLAATTLRVLAARQATVRDDFHEQEPGKILHELRFGELTACGERPHSPYFGAADTTPLFLVLLDEYHRWSGDDELVRTLEPNARAALDWDRRQRRLRRRRVRGVSAAEPDHRAGQPVLEGQLELDSVRRRHARRRADRDLRDPRLRVRRADAQRGSPARSGATKHLPNALSVAPQSCASASAGSSGCPSAAATP